MPRYKGVFGLIGDLVASRSFASRSQLQSALESVLDVASEEVAHLQPLVPTVGDEFQGIYADLASVARASLLVRLLLRPHYDVRIGIGYGDVEVIDTKTRPGIQDGSAWWNAREAINELDRTARRDRRTWLVTTGAGNTTGTTIPSAAVFNAHLMCRDALVDRLGDTGRQILLGSLRGSTQARLSEQLGVTQGAVSQQFSRGVSAVRDAQLLLEKAM